MHIAQNPVTLAGRAMLDVARTYPWGDLEHAYGMATDVPGILLRAIEGAAKERENAIWQLWGNIFHQGTRYAASPAAMRCIIASLAHPHPARRSFLLLLVGLLLGYADGYLVEGYDPTLYDDEESDPPGLLGALQRALDQGADILVGTLHDPDPLVREASAYALAWVKEPAGAVAEALRAALLSESVPFVKAALLLAITYVEEAGTARELLSPYLGAGPLIVRAAAACGLGRLSDEDHPLSAHALSILLGIASGKDQEGMLASVWHDGGLGDFAAAVLAARAPRADALVSEALAEAVEKSSVHQALGNLEALLRATFPEAYSKGAPLSKEQQRALRAVAETHAVWFFANVRDILQDFGLPEMRDEVAALIGLTLPQRDPLEEALERGFALRERLPQVALQSFERAVALSPECVDAWVAMADLREQLGLSGSLDAWREAWRHSRTVPIALRLSAALQKQGAHEEARAVLFDPELELDRDLLDARAALSEEPEAAEPAAPEAEPAEPEPAPPAAELPVRFAPVPVPVVDGLCHAALPLPDGGLLVGGEFLHAGTAHGSLAIFDLEKRQALPAPRVEGAAHWIIGDGQGGWLLSGKFVAVDGQAVSGLVHIKADHTLAPGFLGREPVAAFQLALWRSLVLVVGRGGRFGDTPQNTLVALDLASGDCVWQPRFVGEVASLAVHGDTLMVGGEFQEVEGEPRQGLAAFDLKTRALLPWSPPAEGRVIHLAVDEEYVWVGGDWLKSVGGQEAQVACLRRSDGSVRWAATLNNVRGFTGFALHRGRLYLGANRFSAVAGVARNSLAALDALSGEVLDWSPAPALPDTQHWEDLYVKGRICVRTITPTPAGIFVAGDFDTLGGEPCSQAALLPLEGEGLRESPTWGFDDVVLHAAWQDGKLALVGTFACHTISPARRLLRLDCEGRRVAWAGESEGAVQHLALLGDQILVASLAPGSKDYLQEGRLTALALSTGEPLWQVSCNAPITSLRVGGGRIWIAGEFTRVADAPQWYAAALDEQGRLDPGFAPWPDGKVSDILPLPDGDVLLGGSFSHLALRPFRGLARVRGDTGEPRAWPVTARGDVHGFAPDEDPGVLWVFGSFVEIAGEQRSAVARLALSPPAVTSQDAQLTPEWKGSRASVYGVVKFPGKVVLWGDFVTVRGVPVSRVALLSDGWESVAAVPVAERPNRVVRWGNRLVLLGKGPLGATGRLLVLEEKGGA